MGIQVQELTHGLMPWQKEYIDFSFAGRHISDFGLVAVTSGDRYSFKGSPEFQDETSTVNGVWGQYYWGTNFKTITYEYSLATDGMTERQFEEFKSVFQPGKYGQFYEDTWFNKYCYARVSKVVNFTFIPFQEEVEVAGVKFQGRIYKGECKLTLIQDRPFKYSFYQVLDSKISDLHTLNDNGEAAVRMMYYNNIPAIDSWEKNEKCCIGSWMSLPAKGGTDTDNLFRKRKYIPYYNPSTLFSEAELTFTINRTTTEPNLIEWEPVYFNEIYDSITNPSAPYNIIGLTDSISRKEAIDSFFGRKIKKEFKYSNPEVSSEVNKAIFTAWQFYSENKNGALADLQERLQENLINGKVMLWAIRILQKIQNNSDFYCPENSDTLLIDEAMSQMEIEPVEEMAALEKSTIYFYSSSNNQAPVEVNDIPGCLRTTKVPADISLISKKQKTAEVDWFGYFNLMMLMLFANCAYNEQEDILTPNIFTGFYPYTLHFNGEKGQAFVSYKINELNSDSIITTKEILEENCSNIIASDYLKVEGGDSIEISSGKINSYHLLRFKHDINHDIEVTDVKLKYRYTYI